jgi:hypothetical protein
MDTLRKLQHEFLGHLLDNSATGIVNHIESTPRCSAEERMEFYSNAYILRLKEALSTDFERLHAYLGDELFDDLILQYIDHYPSHHTSLRYFGQYMVEMIEQLDISEQAPEVVEIAKIELAFGNSFDAADCQFVTLNQLAQLEPEKWTSLRLCFHDSVQLLPQHYNSFQIWRALSNEQAPPPKIEDETTWLVWRQDLVSRFRALESAELAALSVALSAGNFADICETLLDHFSEEETPQHAVRYLQQWINDQMVSAIS